MKLKYLGTAAAEGVPAMFCHCETCKQARRKKGKEIRTRCQALIDDSLLIDLGPDTYLHLLAYDLDITDVEHCLITHVHSDHFLLDQLECRMPGYGVLKEGTKPLTIYGSDDVNEMLQSDIGRDIMKSGTVLFEKLVPYEPTQMGEYIVTAFPATHGSLNPYFYSIEKNGRCILYAHDTDAFLDSVWDYFEKNEMYFHLVSMDCTEGFEKVDYVGHMNFEKDLLMKECMIKSKVADENTIFVANHFSHNGHASYETASKAMADHQLVVAYDGMEIEI